MNSLPKSVATNTLAEGSWIPTTVRSGNLAETLRGPGPGGEIQVHGSATLAQRLFAAGMIAEFRTVIAPVLAGSRRRLIPDGCAAAGLGLRSSGTGMGGIASP